MRSYRYVGGGENNPRLGRPPRAPCPGKRHALLTPLPPVRTAAAGFSHFRRHAVREIRRKTVYYSINIDRNFLHPLGQ